MKKIYALIQARFNSTRLPGKVLFKLEDKSVLEHVIARLKQCNFLDGIIVATTILPDDLKIVKLCSTIHTAVYCGSSDDVLDRFYQAARLFNAGHIVRITADCPLIDPGVVDQVVKLHLAKKSDYTSNIINETFPDGEDVEVFTFEALKKAWNDARLFSEREHVTPYIRKHPEIFKHTNLNYPINISDKRWTLDQKEDYRFIKLVYRHLYRKNHCFGMEEVLRFLKANPKYEKINNMIRRNEGYLKSLKEDRLCSGNLR